MSLEWFYRMENAVRISLPDLCEGFEDLEILFDTDPTEKHPSFLFSVEAGNEFEEFCVILFDTTSQEFYSYHFDEEAELHAKVLFSNVDEMLSFIHASFHDYLEEIDEDYVAELDDEENDFGFSDMGELEDSGVEWITNDKYLHIEDNTPDFETKYSIHYRLGLEPETGDGVLVRNSVTKHDDEEVEENIVFFFKEEEAQYIADLMNEYVNRKQ